MLVWRECIVDISHRYHGRSLQVFVYFKSAFPLFKSPLERRSAMIFLSLVALAKATEWPGFCCPQARRAADESRRVIC
jgi:hypothetical protein